MKWSNDFVKSLKFTHYKPLIVQLNGILHIMYMKYKISMKIIHRKTKAIASLLKKM